MAEALAADRVEFHGAKSPIDQAVDIAKAMVERAPRQGPTP